MKIAKDTVVSVSYSLEVKGKEIENVKADNPLKFIFGSGMLHPKIAENLHD